MRLTKKVGLILLPPTVAGLLGVAVLARSVGLSRADRRIAGEVERVVALARELRPWIDMVAAGQEEDRPGLAARALELDGALATLQVGGSGHQDLVPGSQEMTLAGIHDLWRRLEPDVQEIIQAPRGSPVLAGARQRVGATIADLESSLRRLADGAEARARRTQDELLWFFEVAAVGAIAVLLGGVALFRWGIVRPIQQLAQTAQRIGAGDFSARLDIGTRDELAALAHTFNDMASRVEHLLFEVDQRRLHAETIVESVPSPLLAVGADLRAGLANQAFCRAFRLDQAAVEGKALSDLLPAEGLEEAARAVLEAGGISRGRRFGLAAEDGSRRSLLVTIAVTRLAGEGEGLLLVIEDVTEEERLRSRLLTFERRFREVVENAFDGIVLLDGKGSITYFNGAAERAFGWSRDEVLGQSLTMLMPEAQRPARARDLARHLSRDERGLVGGLSSVEGQTKDGRVFPIDLSVSASRHEGELVFTGILRDVTGQRELAAKMMQMDRLIAVGTLAAGVAHEINNPLTNVSANLGHAARELPDIAAFLRQTAAAAPEASELGARLAEVQEAIADALDGSSRVQRIVRDLKVFSRAEQERKGLVELPRVLDSATNIAFNEIRHRARLSRDCTATPLVEADEARLGQVFLNLLVNAAQAIPEGSADQNEIRIVSRTDAAGRAVVEILDTGAGIPPEVQARLFTPFFTTKPAGQGTGLGLSICRNIVEGLGGNIDVTSVPGKGTTFRVSLPPAGSTTPESASPPREVAAGRRGRVLLVDDEPMIGEALSRALRREHTIVPVSSGAEALRKLEHESFDLVLSDLMMPQMTGMELHATLAERHPEHARRMVFLTGGAFTPHAREFLDRVPNGRIEKPVDALHLRVKLREAIG